MGRHLTWAALLLMLAGCASTGTPGVQTALLARTRNKVAALESELAAMTDLVEKLSDRRRQSDCQWQ